MTSKNGQPDNILDGKIQQTSPKIIISVVGDAFGFVPKHWPTHRFRTALIHTMDEFIGGTWLWHECRQTCKIGNILMDTLKEFKKVHDGDEILNASLFRFLNKTKPKKDIQKANQDKPTNSEESKQTVYNMYVENSSEVVPRLETKYSGYYVSCLGEKDNFEMKLPVVILVVEGDQETVKRVAKAVNANIPVVLIKGTGMAADFLYHCVVTEEDVEVQAPLQFGLYFDRNKLEALKGNIKKIKQKKWMVTTFDLENNNSTELTNVAIDVILRNWSTQKLEGIKPAKISQKQKNPICISEAVIKDVSKSTQNGSNGDSSSPSNDNDRAHSSNSYDSDTDEYDEQPKTSLKCCCRQFRCDNKVKTKVEEDKVYISKISPLEFYLFYQMLQDKKMQSTDVIVQSTNEQFEKREIKMYNKLMNEALLAGKSSMVAVLLDRVPIKHFVFRYSELYQQTGVKLRRLLKVQRWKNEAQEAKKEPGRQLNCIEKVQEAKKEVQTAKKEKEIADEKIQKAKKKVLKAEEEFNEAASGRSRKLLRYYRPTPIGDLNYDEEISEGGERQYKSKTRRKFLYLLLWAVLTNKKELAELFWKKSPHPILTALIASALLKKLSRKAFNRKYDSLSEDLDRHSKIFCQRAMDVADNCYSINPDDAVKSLIITEPVIWGISTSCSEFAQKYRLYDFVTHYVAQKSYNSIWYGSPHKETAESVCFVRVCCDRGETCGQYICGLYRAPFTRFCIYYAFFLAFLVCLSAFVLSNLDREPGDPKWLYELMTYIWITGDIIEEYAPAFAIPRRSRFSGCFKIMRSKLRGMRLHFRDIWNLLDFVGYALMITAVIFRYAFGDIDKHSETTRVLFSFTMYIMYMRFLHVLLINRLIGEAVIMLKEALKELLRFMIILGVFIVSTGVFYHANLYPNHHDLFSPFGIRHWSFWRIIYLPFWAIFGELKEELDGVGESGCSSNETIYVNNANIERCPEKNSWVSVMSGIYTTLANLLLVNLIIAMFSFRFEKIRENSKKYWLYQRSSIIIQFKTRAPSPLNIIYWCYRIAKMLAENVKPERLPGTQRIVARRWEPSEKYGQDQGMTA